jgi:hypothetical protein
MRSTPGQRAAQFLNDATVGPDFTSVLAAAGLSNGQRAILEKGLREAYDDWFAVWISPVLKPLEHEVREHFAKENINREA